MIILPSLLFADEEYKKNSVTLSVVPYFKTDDTVVFLDYQRLFVYNHIGASVGSGYIVNDIQKSIFMPVRLTYIPFNFIIKPDIYAGVVLAYNWRDDVDMFDDREPIFDKGFDTCFEWGLGLTVSPIFESVKIGAHARVYQDIKDSAKIYLTIDAGYMF